MTYSRLSQRCRIQETKWLSQLVLANEIDRGSLRKYLEQAGEAV
jgi:hypothetical protein